MLDRALAERWASLIAAWYWRPDLFFRQCLGARLYPWQLRACREITRRLRAGEAHLSLHLRCAHGQGKTFFLAGLTLWWTVTRVDTRGLTTAPSWAAVKDLLWAQMRALFRGSLLPQVGIGSIRTTYLRLGPNWFVAGRATDDPVKLEGTHGPSVIRVIDEAKGVGDEVWEATEGMFSARTSFDACASTPGSASGQFFERDERGGDGLIRVVVTIDEGIAAGVLGMEHLKGKMLERWGEQNEIYRARALAEYMTGALGGAIRTAWVDVALALPPPPNGPEPLCSGLDVGRSTDGDLSVQAFTRGWSLAEPFSKWQERDTMIVAREALVGALRRGAVRFRVDCSGVGGGAFDRCEEILREEFDDRGQPRPLELEEYFEQGVASENDVFENRHAEAVDLAATELRHGRASLSVAGEDGRRFRRDLGQYRLVTRSRSVRYAVEKAADGQPSPDFGDAYLISAGPDVGGGLLELLRERSRDREKHDAERVEAVRRLEGE